MSSSKPYAELPSSANNKEAVRAFTLAVPDADLTRIKTLVRLSNVASANYENTHADKSNEFGLTREWLAAAKERWENHFDWRKREQLVNSFPNFKAAIPVPHRGSPSDTSIEIHFAALFSKKKDAVPVVFLHGWPGSFFEFIPILRLLSEKYPDEAGLPYHVVVPSLPGYGLSDAPPAQRDFGLADAAWMLDHLLTKRLGFTSYVIQGGDVGSFIGRIMGARYPGCKAVHLNCCRVAPPPDFNPDHLDEVDKAGLKRTEWFTTTAVAYAMMHSTRPSTVGLVLMSNPLALLAWIGEKFLDWTDPASFPHTPKSGASSPSARDRYPYSIELMDEAIAGAALYYLAGCAPTSLYPYRDLSPRGKGGSATEHPSPDAHVNAPKILGYSFFPSEVMLAPKDWVARSGNLVFFKRHDKGGHFAALEQPAALLEDVEEFVKLLPAAES
ncbi:epoxide hydrolase [Trichoderma cornu-damae]|uniref:Epoxide hydrolase n=1 Tax=Trichoderma cornu-damae TaxID=654480 RepID=A0A9P8QN57_9HYPO|nr:epoxide hydrolase [Trichoderma cornu-damae]